MEGDVLGYLDRTVRNLDAIHEIAKIERLNAAAAEARKLRDGVEDPETGDEEDFAGLFTTKRVSRVQQQRDEESRIDRYKLPSFQEKAPRRHCRDEGRQEAKSYF